mgnify:FL=1|jgi:hypothetical protein|tara:strand:+ start:752 stop:1045 length:294 start_codon:yes stop_codon:yes gene_type:complete
MGVDFKDKDKSVAQLKAGLAWCRDEFKELYWQKEILDDDERWVKFWDKMSMLQHMEEWLRSIHDFKGCVWGSEGKCQYEQPLTCDYCVKQVDKLNIV